MFDLRALLLWWVARYRIKRDQPMVIAVGGAIAKTSTKMAIGAVLNAAYPGKVTVGYGNLNSYLGVPLAILGFEVDFYKTRVGFWRWLGILFQAKWRMFFQPLKPYLVLEFGTDGPGDIEKITRKIQPDIGVITIVGPAHLANYPTEEAMAKDEGYLAEATKEKGIIFINHDDPYREKHRERTKARVKELVTPLELMATEYAKVVAGELGIDQKVTADALANFVRPEHRFNEKKVGSLLLLDDSYNASPLAMKAALNRLQQLPGRHVAVLGSMLELGDKSPEFHQEIGQYARSRADLIIGVGPEAKDYQADQWYETSEQAAEVIFPYFKQGDSILVKGSKGIKMDRIVRLIENKGEDGH